MKFMDSLYKAHVSKCLFISIWIDQSGPYNILVYDW